MTLTETLTMIDPLAAAVDVGTLEAAWAEALNAPVVLMPSVTLARELLLQALALPPAAWVGVPANVTRSLANVIKDSGAQLHLINLEVDLTLAECTHTAIIWAEPVSGLLGLPAQPVTVLDCADTVPVPRSQPLNASVALYGLHLGTDETQAGALLTFGTDAVGQKLQADLARLRPSVDELIGAKAQLQLRRWLNELVVLQTAVLAETLRGVKEAAGLPVKLLQGASGLPLGVAVQIPDECDPPTFVAYVRGERTPVHWLAALRPMHYAAVRDYALHPGLRNTAQHLARWLLVPVGPKFTPHEISNAVLGLVKAADYLGLRWYTNPTRAAEYATLMTEWYGEGHDAYRPAFRLSS